MILHLGEVLGLGFNWESDSVGFEEGGLHDGKVVVWWVVSEGIHSNTNGSEDKIDDEDWRKERRWWIKVLGFLKNEMTLLPLFK